MNKRKAYAVAVYLENPQTAEKRLIIGSLASDDKEGAIKSREIQKAENENEGFSCVLSAIVPIAVKLQGE